MEPGSTLSVVTPAWNEASNLPLLYRRIVNVLDSLAAEWEWVVVIDHSSDGTFAVLDALGRFSERYNSLTVLIAWMGFRQESVVCDKDVRRFGGSGWTTKAKIALFIDAVTAFTYLPIRLMSYAGILTGLAGFVYAGVVVLNALAGRPPSGWSSLMVALLVVGGMQMLMMGVLG